MPKRSRNAPSDVNKLAAFIVDETTKEASSATREKNPAAVALGRLGGLKGGRARANKLTADTRQKIAQLAAKARWKKQKG